MEFKGFTFVAKEGLKECPKHGQVMTPYLEYPDHVEWQMCPKCVEELEEEERKKAGLQKDSALREKWSLSNVKPKFFGKSFGDYKPETESQRNALALVKAIAEGSSKRSVILAGNNGLGKTMLASLAVMQRGGYIYKMYEIIMRIKSSYKASAKEDEQDILNELSKAPLLVIDEVGKQFGSESERNWLSYVIDERYELDRPTILVSNLKPMRYCSDEEKSQGAYLERYLGRDSVSRLAETADIVFMEGRDWRRGIDTNGN